MDNPAFFKKHRKPILITLGFLGFILIGLFAVSIIAQNIIKSKLNEVNGLKYEDVSITWNCSTINIDNLSYSKDSIEEHPFSCKNLKVSGISWWDYFDTGEVVLNHFDIENATINLLDKFTNSDSSQQSLKTIRIKNVYIINVDLNYAMPGSVKAEVSAINGKISNFEIATDKDSSSFRYDYMELKTAEGKVKNKDGYYSLNWKAADFNTNDKRLSVSKLELDPMHPKHSWDSQFKYKKSRLLLDLDTLTAIGLDDQALFKGKGLFIKELQLENSSLDVYTNQAIASCPNCYKPFIHEQLHKFPLPIDIELVTIKNQDINVEILSEKTGEIGKFSFDDTYASIYDVSNLPEKLKQGHTIKADVKSKILNQASINVSFEFDMKAPNYPYRFNGNINQLVLTTLNPLSYSLQRMRFKSGQVSQMTFNATSNNELASGDMELNYNNLEIQLMEKEGKDKKGLLSFLANKVALNKKNMPGTEDYVKGKMYAPREKNRSIFHHWWETVLSGLRSTILPDIMLKKELK